MSGMKKTTVRVTQKDITEGDMVSSTTCPVARALDRLLKSEYRVYVGTMCIEIFPTDPNVVGYIQIPTPRDVSDFICAFDNGEEVKPFSFSLEVPSELLK